MSSFKERPILFSTAMVQAILDKRKTMTRRVVKGAPTTEINHRLITFDDDGWNWQVDQKGVVSTLHRELDSPLTCPYGKVGEHLAVRETFYAWGRWVTQFDSKKGRDAWHFEDMTADCGETYHYQDNPPAYIQKGKSGAVGWWKRPSIFMPAAACRIKLEITAVRIERLQDISDADAQAEGLKQSSLFGEWGGVVPHKTVPDHFLWFRRATEAFKALWLFINGEASLNANPWVWVISFKEVTL